MGQHGGADALSAFCVGSGAQDRIAIDHGGGFHPSAMLPSGWNVADLVRGTSIGCLNAQTCGEGFALAVKMNGLFINTHACGLLWIKSQLSVGREGLDFGNADDFIAVQTEL